MVSIQTPIKLINNLDHDLEITYQSPSSHAIAKSCANLIVKAGDKECFIPRDEVGKPFYLRPLMINDNNSKTQMRFCTTPIDYVLFLNNSKSVDRSGATSHQTRVCLAQTTPTNPIYKICVSTEIQRLQKSEDPCEKGAERNEKMDNAQSEKSKSNLFESKNYPMPVVISFHSPFIIRNCLPYALKFKLAKRHQNQSNLIQPGTCYHLNSVEPLNDVGIRFQMENFVESESLIVPIHGNAVKVGSSDIREEIMPLYLQDCNGRKLILTARCLYRPSGTIEISVYAQLWFLNKSGLPIILRQHVEGATSYESILIPAQYQEHEQARNLSPLLASSLHHLFDPEIHTFSYSMRLGNKMHSSYESKWCSPFQIGTDHSLYRKLDLCGDDNQQKMVYEISVKVIDGLGDKFGNCKFLVLTARHQIYNRTSYSLQIFQRVSFSNERCKLMKTPKKKPFLAAAPHTDFPNTKIVGQKIAGEADDYLTIFPQSQISFHWSNNGGGEEQNVPVIAVRIILSPCKGTHSTLEHRSQITSLWSGQFSLEVLKSFHLNIRLNNGTSVFVLAENTYIDNVYTTTFWEATSKIPPPYIIINRSSIAVLYYQKGVVDENKRSIINPKSSVPYALDEPQGAKQMCLSLVGGSSGFYDLDNMGDSLSLSYDNYLYINIPSTPLTSSTTAQSKLSLSRCIEDVELETDPHYMHGYKFPKSLPIRPAKLVMEADTDGDFVFLNFKELGNRYQLWKFTPEGHLANLGHTNNRMNQSLTKPVYQGMGVWDEAIAPLKFSDRILDVVDDGFLMGNQHGDGTNYRVRLSAMKSDRKDTQTWIYNTKDLKLTCQRYPSMSLQPKGGFDYAYKGNRVVLSTILPKDAAREKEIPSLNTFITCLESSKDLALLDDKRNNGAVQNKVLKASPKITLENSKPGSGLIFVRLFVKGPLRILDINDALRNDQDKPSSTYPAPSPYLEAKSFKFDSNSCDSSQDDVSIDALIDSAQFGLVRSKWATLDFEIVVKVSDIGMSVIDQERMEELMYLTLSSTDLSISHPAKGDRLVLTASIKNIQLDNQLCEAQTPVALSTEKFVQNSKGKKNDLTRLPNLSALYVLIDKDLTFDNSHIDVFNHVFLYLSECWVHVEEMLVLKILKFLKSCDLINTSKSSLELYDSVLHGDLKGYNYLLPLEKIKTPGKGIKEKVCGPQRMLYATKFIISVSKVNFSISTSPQASYRHTEPSYEKELKDLKKYFNLNLINLQSAPVEMEPFVLLQYHDTWSLLLETMTSHYIQNTKRQAAKILGSVDFLGNPLGLLNDVTQGVTSLIKDGDLTAMICSITHGLSDSTAKVSTELSDQLGRVTMDQSHEIMRHQIKRSNQSPLMSSTQIISSNSGSSTRSTNSDLVNLNSKQLPVVARSLDHMVTAVEGLTIGFVGGVMSLFTQTYDGVSKDGIEGLIPGIGKGVIGSFAKPITGVLDFISGTAKAIKVTASLGSKNVGHCQQVRTPACCYDTWDALPLYSQSRSSANILLLQLNDYDASVEKLIAFHYWMAALKKSEALRLLLITDCNAYILEAQNDQNFKIKYQIPMHIVQTASVLVKEDTRYAMVIQLKYGDSLIPLTLPVPSQTEASQLIDRLMYARYLYETKQRKLRQI